MLQLMLCHTIVLWHVQLAHLLAGLLLQRCTPLVVRLLHNRSLLSGRHLGPTSGRGWGSALPAATCCLVSGRLLLLPLQPLLQVHLHVSLLLVAPGKLLAARLAAERFLARVSPLVGCQVVASAEGSGALLLADERVTRSS